MVFAITEARNVIRKIRAEELIDDFIPEATILGIIDQESRFNQWSSRFEQGYPYIEKPEFWATRMGIGIRTEINQQQTSWGLMQVMGGTARWLYCSSPYLTVLCEPIMGIRFGLLLLKRLQERYSNHITDKREWIKAILSAYNGGPGAVEIDDSKLINIKNPHYVSEVLERSERFK